MITVLVDKALETYVVYSHKDHTGIIKYIGVTLLQDLFTLRDARQNSLWNSIFILTVETEILLQTTNSLDAYREQKRLVDLHRPHCNVRGYQSIEKNQNVRCNETGEVFGSASQASIVHRVSYSAIYNHLKGKVGHKSVKGRTYSYTFDKITVDKF